MAMWNVAWNRSEEGEKKMSEPIADVLGEIFDVFDPSAKRSAASALAQRSLGRDEAVQDIRGGV